MRLHVSLRAFALMAMLAFAAPMTHSLYAEDAPAVAETVVVTDTAPVPAVPDATTSIIDVSDGLGGAIQGFQNAPDGASWWVILIYVVVGAVMAIFGGGYLQTKANELKLRASQVQGDLKQKAWLSLQAYALERADAKLQKDVWGIAKRVHAGELNEAHEIKALLRQLGQEEKTELVAYFKTQFPELAGGNLFEAFGEKYIDQLIEWAANKVCSQIPEFAGKDTAETLINGGAKRLLTYGITHALDYGIGKIEGVLIPTEPVDPPADPS